jgi:serine/threonine protein kinase/Flp pilus assembly protein TadD
MAEDHHDRNSSGTEPAEEPQAKMPAPSAVTADAVTLEEPPANGRPLHDVGPGSVIAGRYKLLRQIGQGGFGVVYLADQDRPVRRRVAVKLIKLGMDSEQVLARFDAERQALALLSHPNVAAVYDAGVTDAGRPFFVMEYVPGEPITTFCDRHRYTTRQRLELFMQACEAVQHAHQKAIIHRDLKPSNLLVALQEGDKPLLKVIDFGVAKATAHRLTEHTLFTEQGQLIGTPEYMSPEQAALNAVDVDTRTDIYSLGVVLYELLTGAVPFDPKTLRNAAFAQIQRILREQDPPRPSTRLSGLGESAVEIAKHRQTQPGALERELRGDLEWIPLKALRKERSERYRTAAELSEDVRHYLDDEPLLAGPESAVYRAWKFLRRNRGLVASLGAISAILVAAVFVSTWQAVRATHAEARSLVAAAETGRERDQALAEKKRANEQAAIAQAVSTFLQDMLSATAPWRRLGRDVTVAGAVREAVNRLNNGELAGQPLTEAAVRLSIGETLIAIDHPDEARPNFQRSLELRRRWLKPNHPDIAKALDRLGGLYTDNGLNDKAEDVFREAIRIYRAGLPACEKDYSYTLTGFSSALRNLKRPREAEPLVLEALEIRKRVGTILEVAHAWSHLAMTYDAEGRLDDAEAAYKQRIELLRKASPANATESVRELAAVMKKNGKLAEAAKLYDELLDATGKENPLERAATLRSQAALFKQLGRFDEAEARYREAVELRLANGPPGDPMTASSLAGLTMFLEERGRVRDAAEAFDKYGKPFVEGLTKARKQLKEAAWVAQSLFFVGSSLQHGGRYKDAEVYYREALSIRRHVSDEYSSAVVEVLTRLSKMLDAQGQTDRADELWNETLSIRLKKVLPSDLAKRRPEVYHGVVDPMLKAGHVRQAYQFCKEALAAGPTNAETFNALAWHMSVPEHVNGRDPALAVQAAKRALDIAPEVHSRNTLGLALYRAGEFARAVQELEVCVKTNADDPEPCDFVILAMACERLGRHDAALASYKRADQLKGASWQKDDFRALFAEAERTLGLRPPTSRRATTQSGTSQPASDPSP